MKCEVKSKKYTKTWNDEAERGENPLLSSSREGSENPIEVTVKRSGLNRLNSLNR